MKRVKCENCNKSKNETEFSGLKSEGNWTDICWACDRKINVVDTGCIEKRRPRKRISK